MKKFFAVIGNPPYQDESSGEQKNFAPPIYNSFMDEAYKVAEKVTLVTPARFLFNAGSTPKKWNEKIINTLEYPRFSGVGASLDNVQPISKVYNTVNLSGSGYTQSLDHKTMHPYASFDSVALSLMYCNTPSSV